MNSHNDKRMNTTGHSAFIFVALRAVGLGKVTEEKSRTSQRNKGEENANFWNFIVDYILQTNALI